MPYLHLHLSPLETLLLLAFLWSLLVLLCLYGLTRTRHSETRRSQKRYSEKALYPAPTTGRKSAPRRQASEARSPRSSAAYSTSVTPVTPAPPQPRGALKPYGRQERVSESPRVSVVKEERVERKRTDIKAAAQRPYYDEDDENPFDTYSRRSRNDGDF